MYLLKNIKKSGKIITDWYFVDSIDQISYKEHLSNTFYVKDRSNRLSVNY
ncbi:uncharacterized protein METZ01_LOCUS56600 [marine metagenome]|uniref:Uncharacterized protein n=1 Tax=marine metagenome TaxID=408172 RepID=A0A381SIE0_9ZZZZ